jgi:predicted dehydrogenase
MASTYEQATTLVETSREAGTVYAVGYMKRYDTGVRKAKGILESLLVSGELGPVRYVRSHCFGGNAYCNIGGHLTTGEAFEYELPRWPIAPAWVPEGLKKEYERFLNTYCHNINLLRFLVGSTLKVTSVSFNGQAEWVIILDAGDYNVLLETGITRIMVGMRLRRYISPTAGSAYPLRHPCLGCTRSHRDISKRAGA